MNRTNKCSCVQVSSQKVCEYRYNSLFPKAGIYNLMFGFSTEAKSANIWNICERNCLIWINELTIKVICEANRRLILCYHRFAHTHTCSHVCSFAHECEWLEFSDNDPKSQKPKRMFYCFWNWFCDSFNTNFTYLKFAKSLNIHLKSHKIQKMQAMLVHLKMNKITYTKNRINSVWD